MTEAVEKPTPSQLAMLLGWERELGRQHDPGTGAGIMNGDQPGAGAGIANGDQPRPAADTAPGGQPAPGADTADGGADTEPAPGADTADGDQPGPASDTADGDQPGPGKQVLKLRDWITHTLATALFALQEEGSIRMEYVERKKLGVFPSRHVMVTKAGPTLFSMGSFEGQLWARLGEKTVSVSRLVGGWYGGTAGDPWAKAKGLIQHNLLEAGLVTKQQEDAHRGRVRGAVFGKTKTMFRANGQAREHRAEVEALHARLMQPDETAGGLRDKVFKEVARLIASKKTPDAGG